MCHVSGVRELRWVGIRTGLPAEGFFCRPETAEVYGKAYSMGRQGELS